MLIKDILSQRTQGAAFEFFPPKTERARTALEQTVRELKRFAPLYVSMTYGAGGSAQDTTRQALALLLSQRPLEIMPHLTCVNAEREAIAALLADYQQMGLENIMALRGDPPQQERALPAADLPYAIDMVRLLKERFGFGIGVAVYPEGHIESPSWDEDMQRMREKIQAGADFAVTQMFFQNDFFYRMVDAFRATGVDIPLLPGILPLTDVAKVKQFAAVCRATIPEHIERSLRRYAGCPEDMEKAGVDVTIAQCRDLQQHGFRQLHFFTLNKPRVMRALLSALGFPEAES